MSVIRYCAYNLLNGGIDTTRCEDRRGTQVEILRPLEVDVLALPECTHWDEGDFWRLHWLANELKLAVFGVVQTQRYTGMTSPNFTALLYRPERLRVISGTTQLGHGALHHGAIRALLVDRDDQDKEYLVHATHLTWTDGERRLDESRWFTDKAQGRTILMGDLNADVPTAPEPNWSNIPRNLHSRYRRVLPDGTYGPADRRCTANLLNAGYVDPGVYLGLKPAPTTGHYYDNEPEPQTLDHILVGAELADDIEEYWTVDTDEARTASDHLPKVLDLIT
ncbi:endonuclease/exonuclease/phosphatase family protein [Streptomyces sp. TS71-3]|uniref:endonuclease/exonuclease/phosphatase family protein n=1 Tax=Streptomyces sp. TS71-3 TaxID=2733862 RepID=UPI001B154095|nr:endonuclease/exonuclease/phosphatase family protein [Streptomyces sp. TS71-3]GHJ36021.1 hypothetical protein Sm713_16300 [Streptomyces sp. TS71-3]